MYQNYHFGQVNLFFFVFLLLNASSFFVNLLRENISGALKAQVGAMGGPVEMLGWNGLVEIMKTCIILHYMIIGDASNNSDEVLLIFHSGLKLTFNPQPKSI